MPESNLSLTYEEIRSEVAHFMGHGYGPLHGEREWTRQEEAAIESCIRSGQRQFYNPPPVPPETSAYNWSFMHPTAELAIAEDEYIIPLPADFGGLEGEIYIKATTASGYVPILNVGEGMINQSRSALPDATGRPDVAAIVPLRGTTANSGQRYELWVWPKANADFTLQVQYYVNPGSISKLLPYHLGGSMHAETILESCLAIAESRTQDNVGVHRSAFMERLKASIDADRRLKPRRLGYNRDMSDAMEAQASILRGEHHYGARVTYNNVQY